MSLQVCHCCGWSKMTTYQGLRIHQGRMGCTPKGVRIAEPQQQYMWDYVGPPKVQMDLKVDVCSPFMKETRDHYSDQSLQVCHCGWSKMTTYRGLRIHQGKMGCTPKGIRIPKTEQYAWNYCWGDEVGYNRNPPTKRVSFKKETLPEAPRTGNRRDSAAATATIEEYKSSAPGVPQRSSHRAKSKPANEKLSAHPQVFRPVREPSAPANPEDGVRLRNKNIRHQLLPESTFSGDMGGFQSAESNSGCTAGAFRIKQESKSPFAALDQSLQTTAEIKWRQRLQDFSTDVQVQQVYRETPTAPAVRPKERNRKHQTPSQGLVSKHPPIVYLEPGVQAKENQRKHQIFSQLDHQVNRSAREQPSAPPAVPRKKKEASAFMAKRSETLLPQETLNMLQRKMKMREENSDIKPLSPNRKPKLPVQRFSAPTSQSPAVRLKEEDMGKEEVSQVAPVPLRISSPATAAKPEEKRSPFTPQPINTKSDHQLQDFSAAEQVNISVREQLPSPPVVPPKKKDSPFLKINQETSDSESGGEMPSVLQGKKMVVEKFRDINRPVETVHEVNRSAREQLSAPPVALHEKKDAPAFMAKRSESLLRQETLNMLQRKMKMREENGDSKSLELDRENVLVPPRTNSPEKPEEKKSSFTPQPINTKSDHQLQDFSAAEQVNISVREQLSAPPVVPPKKKDSPLLKINQETSDSESGGEIHSYLQGNKMVVERLRDINRPVETVLERIDSPTKAAVGEENKSPSAPQPSLRNLPIADHQLQDFSAAEQANRSVTKHSKIPPAVPPKRKDSALFKTVNVTSAPTKTTAVTEVSEKEDPPSSHKVSWSGFSTGVKVKELARMFSATTAQEKAAQPKEKFREGHRLSQAKLLAQTFSAITAQKTTKGEDREELNLEKDVTGTISNITHPATAEATKNEDPQTFYEAAQTLFSTGVKVKELAQMFSAQEVAVQLNKKHREDKPSEVKVLAQRFLPPTAEGTAIQAGERREEEQELAQKLADPAAAKPSEEEPKSSCETTQPSSFSTGLKVKDLARMFSAAAMQETAGRTKDTPGQMAGLEAKQPEAMKTVEDAKQQSLDFSSSSLRSTAANSAE